MNAQAVRHLTARPSKELQVRLILVEEGSSPGALLYKDDVGTTAVVAISDEPSSRLAARIERRIAELSRSGRAVKEVMYLVASNAHDGSARRGDALRAAVRASQGTIAGVVLVVPHERSALRSELFELTTALMAEAGPSLRVELRFAAAPDERPSGIFPSPAGVHQTSTRGDLGGAIGTLLAG